MMALDAKTIKEEIQDKDIYDSNSRRSKAKEQCRSPDSPESVRAVAPKSPISPQHHSLALPRSHRNGSSSPIVNGSSTPPPASSASTPHAVTPSSILQDSTRALAKVKRFLGALVQFGQDTSPDIGDRVRSLILSLASGGLSSDEFRIALQEATNFPLRPYVLPFLKTHIPFLQREIASLSRSCNQSTIQYARLNENSVFEYAHPTDHTDIFLPIEVTTNNSGQQLNGNGVILKRRSSESYYDHQNGPHEWNDYMVPTSKRPHLMVGSGGGHIFSGHQPLFDYQSGTNNHVESFTSMLEKQTNQRDDRETRGMMTDAQRGSNNSSNRSLGGEEEWKNIHTMLNCISAMVDKTKRAITILQQRGVVETNPHQSSSYQQDPSFLDIKRQTEEKVAEFRRNAEDAVNQVKRQAVVEIQRAVAAAESRAVEMMAQERIKMEKMFAEMNKNSSDDNESQSPAVPGSQNVCWNCGRKANETCSGCNLARYCGAFCQHKDWEQHHQICGNSRIDPNSSKHPPPHFRPSVPPSRTSPSQTQQQQQQQQPQTLSVNINSNGLSSAPGVK